MRARRTYQLLPSDWDALDEATKDELLAEQIYIENQTQDIRDKAKTKGKDEHGNDIEYTPLEVSVMSILALLTQ